MDNGRPAQMPHANPFDARGPFLLSLFMTLVGYSVLVALPAINGAWVEQLGFSEVEVNRVASADLLGLFLGAVHHEPSHPDALTGNSLTYLGIFLAVSRPTALCTQYVDYRHHFTAPLLRGWAGSRVLYRRRRRRAWRALQAARGVQLDVAGLCHLAVY